MAFMLLRAVVTSLLSLRFHKTEVREDLIQDGGGEWGGARAWLREFPPPPPQDDGLQEWPSHNLPRGDSMRSCDSTKVR